jgi:hypothetical protein
MKEGRGGWRRRVVRCTAATASIWAMTPVAAQAGGTAVVGDSAVCTITGTVLLSAPASLAPSYSTVDALFVASGTCTGVQTVPVSITLDALAAVGPTCAQIVVLNSRGTLQRGSQPQYSATGYLAGPTTAPALALVTSPIAGGVVGAGQLTLAPASLLACVQGGTTSLQYDGVLVLAG